MIERLDRALETILARAPSAIAIDDEEISPLAAIASDLRGMPRENFKARLKSELQRRTVMASSAQNATPSAQEVPASRREGEAAKVDFIRKGFRSLTPYLILDGADNFMEFAKKAFNAEPTFRVPGAQGKVMHAELRVEGEMIEFADSNLEFPPMPSALHLYVSDVDACYARALEAGAKSIAGPTDQEYGERSASVADPFGNQWYIAKRFASAPAPANAPQLIICMRPERSSDVIDFMVNGCGAEVAERFDGPEGRVIYAKIRLGNSFVELGDAHGPYQPMPTTIHCYLPDTDAAYQRAIAAGAKPLREPRDEAYGDRSAGVTDPFGNRWFFATHIRDVKF